MLADEVHAYKKETHVQKKKKYIAPLADEVHAQLDGATRPARGEGREGGAASLLSVVPRLDRG